MPNQASGLRFDIFERIHLDNEIQGIESLEELELVPYIEVEPKDEQALLKGHLQLTASYVEQNGENRDNRTLEYQIPVEITLPMSRVQNLEEIGIRIDHFDVDLVAPRSMNVTGVLSLSGINTSQADQTQAWEQEQEFVHEVKGIPGLDHSLESDSEPEQASELQQTARTSSEERLSLHSLERQAESQQTEFTQTAEQEENAEVERVEEQTLEAEQDMETEATEELNNQVPAEEELEPEQAAEEKTGSKRIEPKIAFASKKEAEETEPEQVQSLLNKRSSPEKSPVITEEDIEEVEAEQARPADELEWKKLFLNRDGEEQQQFSQMRLCIVQKEETLEGIAERYGKNPRELQLCNRMGEQTSIEEGQIIYIPQ